jgi:hypothetical protein
MTRPPQRESMARRCGEHLTYDLTLAAAHSILAVNDQLTFCHVSLCSDQAGLPADMPPLTVAKPK